MQQYKRFLALSAIFVGSFATSIAQDAKRASLHPGDVIHYELRFEGHDAKRVTGATMVLNNQTAPLPGQAYLASSMGGSNVRITSDGVLYVDIKIPEGVQTGDYQASVSISGGFIYLYSTEEVGLPLVHLVSDGSFDPPKIRARQLP